jgi:hypothetical protein
MPGVFTNEEYVDMHFVRGFYNAIGRDFVRVDVFTAVTTKNGVFLDVMPRGFVRTDVSEELNVFVAFVGR